MIVEMLREISICQPGIHIYSLCRFTFLVCVQSCLCASRVRCDSYDNFRKRVSGWSLRRTAPSTSSAKTSRWMGLFFADSQNQQMKCLDVQTGAFHVVFAEAEPGWVVCNSRLLDSRHSDILVVSERNNKVSRVVIAKKNTCGHYVTDHAVILDETSWVS